jgi:hypothetical protein
LVKNLVKNPHPHWPIRGQITARGCVATGKRRAAVATGICRAKGHHLNSAALEHSNLNCATTIFTLDSGTSTLPVEDEMLMQTHDEYLADEEEEAIRVLETVVVDHDGPKSIEQRDRDLSEVSVASKSVDME